jgi:broad specificity phosphatase PhoE
VNFTLMRHGETVAGSRYCGSTDTPLSERGLAQMRTAVRGRRWDRVVSSPLRRCAEFARLLAQDLAVPCHQERRLREIHFGDWEGRSAAELIELAPESLRRFWENPLDHPPPGAEPLPELQARVLDAWAELIRDGGGSTLLVTHGGPIRVLLAHFAAWPLSGLLQIEVAHAALIDVAAAANAE